RSNSRQTLSPDPSTQRGRGAGRSALVLVPSPFGGRVRERVRRRAVGAARSAHLPASKQSPPDLNCSAPQRKFGQGEVVVVEPFRIHVADEVLDDLRARLRHTRWPDQIPGIGWEQGTELGWLQRLVSYWAEKFDWRAWERRLNAFDHFVWDGIHFVYQRAASG